MNQIQKKKIKKYHVCNIICMFHDFIKFIQPDMEKKYMPILLVNTCTMT